MELGESNKFINTEVLEHIFSFLDVPSLLQCSEVCSNFLELTKSTKISEKMKLLLNFGCDTEEELNNLVRFMEDRENFHREYHHVEVVKFRDAYLIDDVQDTFTEFMTAIGSSLTALKLNNCEIDRDIIIEMFKSMPNLQELAVDGVELEVQGAAMVDEEETGEFPTMGNLKTFHLISSDFFFLMLIAKCENLRELTVDNPSFSRTDVEKLEDFILNQTHLKNLTLKSVRFNSSYSSARLADVPFQLQQLRLKNASWDIKEHAEGFMNSQKNLEKLVIYSRNLTFNQFKHIMGCNKKLKSLEIGEPLSVSGELIEGLIMPATLTSLKFEWTSDFFVGLISTLRNLTHLDIHICGEAPGSSNIVPAINGLSSLQDLKLKATKFDFHKLTLPQLKTITLKLDGITKIQNELVTFFANHQNIEQVELNIHPVKANELTFLPPTVTFLTMQSLEITSCACVAQIASALPNLKVLRIEDAFKRSSESSILLTMKNYGIDFKILK